ncbi:MAG: hypothetical protein E6423_09835 [Clostridium sp.]|jgi:hypothetical protein|uniref:hypothetical protein n=1 Tax=Clostridium TaxID=1485 RepID=UPI002330EEEB|nr:MULTISPECIES: hypothetical protein [Clostridium]MDB2104914.1 hypothetical protein [Clostridium paraputrificum]MDU2108880.1 hypothetical protein [Clostridium sp.]MDU3355721.1 hypothetical protein [Clostridium sp.]MDU6809078.1 hypothetical protein [Clostridium sp.]
MEYEIKNRKHFTISNEANEYIKQVRSERKIRSESEALEHIVKEHKEKSDTTTEQMIKIIANEVAKELKGELTKIIKGINSADRNTQIVMEMLNGLFIKSNVGYINTSDIVKAEGLELAEESVRKRISKSRVRKLDNE